MNSQPQMKSSSILNNTEGQVLVRAAVTRYDPQIDNYAIFPDMYSMQFSQVKTWKANLATGT